MIKAAIFDLDGTLLDTVDDLADCMNEALTAHGLPNQPREAFFTLVGNGVLDLVRRATPPGFPEPERVMHTYREAYERGWKRKTVAYPGVSEMLAALQDRQFPMAVLSNKPQHFTRLCMEHFFPEIYFHPLLGQREEVPRKPDPAAAFEIAAEFGLKPEEIAFVGDTSTDMHTAVNAGMVPIGVTWGFRSEAELLETGARYLCRTAPELQSLLRP